MSNLPRGIRNHNPGNIERGDPWQGLAPDQSSDPRFCVFISPEWGIRAIARVLISYQDRHGIYTIRGIVNRWAPSSENDTSSYAHHVARLVGIDEDTGERSLGNLPNPNSGKLMVFVDIPLDFVIRELGLTRNLPEEEV